MNNNKNFKIIYTITEEVQQELQPSQNLSSATELRGIRELGRIDKAILIKYLSDDELQNSILHVWAARNDKSYTRYASGCRQDSKRNYYYYYYYYG